MKIKSILLGIVIAFSCSLSAQENVYKFTKVVENPATPIKDQAETGTCWCFATVSFLESELLRMGKGEYDLSEMFIVRNNYIRRMNDNYLRRGRGNVSQGSIAHMNIWVMDNVGLMPEEVYDGINYDSATHNHGELAKWVKTVSDAAVEMKTPLKPEIVNGVLDAYLGQVPETFTYKGKEYTPHSFAASLPIKMDDYVEITSFTHHPFYSKFVLEVPDNWMWDAMYNVPMNEMMAIVDACVEANHPVAWGTDVSEKGFSRQKAIAVIPEVVEKNTIGSDAEHWGKLSDAEKQAMINNLEGPMKEKTITQEMRQEAYDNYENTDDHGMVIVGTAVDQQGNPFFKVQNSWGDKGPYKGFYYFSRPFVEYKTMDIMVNKNVVPKEILKKIGLK